MLRYTLSFCVLCLSMASKAYVVNQQQTYRPSETHSVAGSTIDILASALAETNNAGAGAIAARNQLLDSASLAQYANNYSPPLTNTYGPVADFVNIALPKRALVYTSDLQFLNKGSGHLKLQTGNSFSVAAI